MGDIREMQSNFESMLKSGDVAGMAKLTQEYEIGRAHV